MAPVLPYTDDAGHSRRRTARLTRVDPAGTIGYNAVENEVFGSGRARGPISARRDGGRSRVVWGTARPAKEHRGDGGEDPDTGQARDDGEDGDAAEARSDDTVR